MPVVPEPLSSVPTGHDVPVSAAPEPGSAPGGSQRSLVVLSPHLDDAVLSVGALIAGAARSGPVTVCTAYTRPPDLAAVPVRWHRFADYRTRLAEDDRALALLGAGAERWDLSERIWRTPPVRTLAGLFRTPPELASFAQVPELVARVGRLLERPEVHLLAPLGIGNHVDHVELAVAALIAATERDALDRVQFYEDFYALGEAARRRHPVGRGSAVSIRRSPGWAAPREGAVLRATALLARGPAAPDYLPELSEPFARRWRCSPQPVGGWEELKLAAVAAYRSQTAALGGMPGLARMLRRAHRLRGGEPLWSLAYSAEGSS